jgi:single-stranded-DNA-specific exonuclease
MVDEVLERARAMEDPILVLGEDGWHPGVIGIVAARVAEQLGKPTLLIAFDGARGRGSGRSAHTLHLRDALLLCSDCLLAHGGHAAAVGLEIERDRLDEFRRAINERAGPLVASAQAVKPDGLADLGELDMASMRRLDMLGPFGAGNPRPSFTTRGVRIAGRPQVDSRGQDLRFRVAQRGTVLPARIKSGGHRLTEVLALDMPVAVTYVPRRVPRAEEGPVELVVTDLRADHAAAEARKRSAPP